MCTLFDTYDKLTIKQKGKRRIKLIKFVLNLNSVEIKTRLKKIFDFIIMLKKPDLQSWGETLPLVLFSLNLHYIIAIMSSFFAP